jgi:hypothetical protein
MVHDSPGILGQCIYLHPATHKINGLRSTGCRTELPLISSDEGFLKLSQCAIVLRSVRNKTA